MPDSTERRIDWICVTPQTPLLELLERQESAGKQGLPGGILLVVDSTGVLEGTITDGDIRRALLTDQRLDLTAEDVLRRDPIRFPETYSFRDILSHLPRELERRGRRSQTFLGKIVLVDADDRPTRVIDYHQLWEQRVASHRHVAILGLGYVGLTLAVELANSGLRVTGVDIDRERVRRLKQGESHVHEPGLTEILREQLEQNLSIETELPSSCDVFIIAVGTPVQPASGSARFEPDLRALTAATTAVGSALQPGGLVVYRSTVPVGTTREVALPILERESGLGCGRGFHLAFAPERTAEGAALVELRTLPQLVGGFDTDSLEATAALFRELTPAVVRLDSLEAAELAKLINNSFRDLSFAFANEVSRLAEPHNLDVVQIIRSANHGYPRSRVPVPSPGVGGPCLSKDPYILSALDPSDGGTLFEVGRRVNETMPSFVAQRILRELERSGKELSSARVALCGLAFKGEPETNDLRESPSIAIAEELAPQVGEIVVYDPIVPAATVGSRGLTFLDLDEAVDGADALAFLNNHRSFESVDIFSMVRAMRSPAVIYDGWSLFRPEDVLRSARATYLGPGLRMTSIPEES